MSKYKTKLLLFSKENLNKYKNRVPTKISEKKSKEKKNKNLRKNYQKFLSKIKEICNISLILF